MVLQNVIIQTPEGLPIFGRSLMCNIGMRCIDLSKDATFDDETVLQSGLLSAMLSYNQAKPGKFHELQLDTSKILSYPTEDLIAIFSVSPEDDTEELKNRLKVMVDLFQDNYSEELENFDGNVNLFQEFQKVIEENGILDEGEEFKKICTNCKYSKSCAFRVTTGPIYLNLSERFAQIKDSNMIQKMILMMIGMMFPSRALSYKTK